MARKTQIQKLMSDVQDPSDFPQQSEAPGLRLLDYALRCTICSELFDGPVTLKCGHCFCSLCIRQSLAEKQECPACREDDVNEGHLRRNPVVEEAVSAWKQCRSFILQILDENGRMDDERSRPLKRRKFSDEPPSFNNVRCTDSTMSDVPRKPNHPGSGSDAPHTDQISTTGQPDDIIKCPSCDKHVKYKDINEHLDKKCQDETGSVPPSSKSQWDNILGSKSKVKSSKKRGKERAPSEEMDSPLPVKSYNTLKDKAIRELLQEYDLPTIGDRKTILARHQRWVIMYNANLDKTHGLRKTLSVLRRELRDWETQQKNKPKQTLQDPTVYQINQKSEFDMLVEAARPKKIQALSSRHEPTSSRDGSISKTQSSLPSEDVIVVDSGEEN